MAATLEPTSTRTAAPLESGRTISSPGTTAKVFAGADSQTFLRLLVAQVRYQNPLSPTSGQEYLAQTAQFAVVEGIQKLAEQMVEQLALNKATLAATYVGRRVVGSDVDGSPRTGTVLAVTYADGKPLLHIEGGTLPLDRVEGVSAPSAAAVTLVDRSEERRVGKECA